MQIWMVNGSISTGELEKLQLQIVSIHHGQYCIW